MRGLLAPLIKLVVFLVVTFLFTYVLAATISNASFGDTNSYKAIFSDVTGLEQGDDVRIAGVRVGTVGDITILRRLDKPAVAEVSFTVEKSRPLPADVQARLRYRNLVGQRYVDVEQGPGDTNKMLAPGDTIPLQPHQAGRRPHRAVPGLPAARPGSGRPTRSTSSRSRSSRPCRARAARCSCCSPTWPRSPARSPTRTSSSAT